jgi:uncharacterized protein (DUF1800 family)
MNGSNIRWRQPVWLLAAFSLLALARSGDRVAAQAAGPPSGVYELVSRNSGKCLDVTGGSLDDLAPVVQWSCGQAASQRWTLQPVGDGYYQLVNVASGKVLDVAYESLDDYGTIIQYRSHNGTNQQWSLQPTGDGFYFLLARNSGKALDVYGWSTADGAPLIQYSLHGGANQQWEFRSGSEELSTADIVRFLEQSTWGPTPELIEHVRSVGLEGFLEEQFAAPMSSYPTLPPYPTTRDTVNCTNTNSTCQRDNYSMYLLQNQFFRNALYGPDQLRQRIAFALHQIIVVSGVDINLPNWMAPYLQILDRNAFGNYRDVLYEITLNPAMGNYLDVTGNTRTRPNENYAREVLQLFTIGTFKLNLDGSQQLDAQNQPIPTYGQNEVNNFARVFTGWVRATQFATGVPNYIDPMVTNEGQHDTGAKQLLNGVTLPANQNTRKDTSDAIGNIFNDPNIGPFISKQLIQHLVTSNPSPAYVARVATVFNGNGGAPRGDLKAVIRTILLDAEARGAPKTEPNYGRLRHPAQFIVNVLRAFHAGSRDLGAESDGYLNPQSVNMGMDVFRPPSVFSYFSPSAGVPGGGGLRGPEFGLLSTSTSLVRDNFINTMIPPNSGAATGGINVSTNSPSGTAVNLAPLQALASNPQAMLDYLDVLLLHGTMSAEMRSSIIGAVNAVSATNTLKRARTAAYLVLTSSQYQVER